jgi:hypothetical protein
MQGVIGISVCIKNGQKGGAAVEESDNPVNE